MTEQNKAWTPANKPVLDDVIGGIKIVKANELPDWGVCLAIFGPPGVGKTDLAVQAADSKYGAPVLYCGVEGGERTFGDRGDVDVARASTWKQVKDFTTNLTSRTNKRHGTVIHDNLTEYMALCKRNIVGNARMQIQDYQVLTDDMLWFTRTWRDYAQKYSVNVIFVMWEDAGRDEESKRTRYDVAFTNKLSQQFPGIVDIVGHLTIEVGGQRHLSFNAGPNTAAKFRRNRSEVAMQIPLDLYYGINEKPLVDLLATLKGGESFPTSKYKRFSGGGTQQQGSGSGTGTGAGTTTGSGPASQSQTSGTQQQANNQEKETK